MEDDVNEVTKHLSGEAYGGRILSLIPAPDGWSVRTHISEWRKGESRDEEGPVTWRLIAWALVAVPFRDGSTGTRVDPVWLDESAGFTEHASEYRWTHSAGHVDDDGWRSVVRVDVIPPQV